MAMLPVPSSASRPDPPALIPGIAPGNATSAIDRLGRSRLIRAVRSNTKAIFGAAILVFFLLVAVFPGQIAKDDPFSYAYPRMTGPSAAHWFGTTALGQDIYSQTVWSTRQVLIVAVIVGLATTVLAMLIGVAAAYLGGLWDNVLNLVTDVMLVIPLFPLLIMIIGYVRTAGTGILVIVLTATGWSYTARQLRAQALSLRQRDFLEAARVRGERAIYIIVVEILPTMTSLLVASFLTNALYAVLFSSSLQFIGFLDPTTLGWGAMLYWAQQGGALQTGQYFWAIVPGACVLLLGAGFALLNYAFDEIGNPALRPVRSPRVKPAG